MLTAHKKVLGTIAACRTGELGLVPRASAH
jgi:hypothetical protein